MTQSIKPSRTNIFATYLQRLAVLTLFAGALGTGTMRAQDAPPPPQQGQGGARGGGGPEQQARQLEMMTKQLNLTPDQVSQVKAIQEDGRTRAMAMREDTSIPQQDKRAKRMAMMEEEQTKIKAVLTEDQKAKFEVMQEKMRERRQRGGDGQGPPPAPPSQ